MMGERVFRTALRLFPAWFRDRYGDDMVADLSRRAARVRASSGRLRSLLFVAGAIADVPAAAWQVRRNGTATEAPRLGVSSAWLEDAVGALRSLRRAPAWTVTAMAILMLGIGGTTAVFSVLNAVLLQPLPYDRPESLASLWTVNLAQDLPDGSSWENARDWVERSRSVEDATLYFRPEFTTSTVTSFGEPERIHVGLVAPNFFELLGVGAVAGRVFGRADLSEDARVAVIAEGLWADRYGRDPAAIGSTITINGDEIRVLGVVPSSVGLPREETRIWQLGDFRTPEGQDYRGWDALLVIARLADGVTPEAAESELRPLAAQLADEYPVANRDRSVRVRALRSEIVGDRLPLLLWTLFGSMFLVLGVGATNVAQLMLGRTLKRRRQLALRSALGASRRRINRQLLFEGLILSLASGVGGVILARLGLAGLVAIIPPDVPLTRDVRMDWLVLLAGFLSAAVIAPLVGLLPALRGASVAAADALRSGGRGVTPVDRRLRSLLVIGEVAMAVVLLAGAGLLVRSAAAIEAIDPGFDARHTLIARINVPAFEEAADAQAFQDAFLGRLRGHAGVLGAGAITQFFIERIPDQRITFVGDTPRDPGEPAPRLTSDEVAPGFFTALGVPLLRGRSFQPGDLGERPRNALVNQTWVETFADGRDPVGLQFRWGDRTEGDAITVVGVVGDLRRTTLDERPYPQIYFAGAQPQFDVLLRTRAEPDDLVSMVRTELHAMEPGGALSRAGSVWDRYGEGLARRRFQTLLFQVFAGLATLLAAIGLFAVQYDSVTARRREIGIRLALGAEPGGIRGMILRHGVGLATLGLGLGLIGVAALAPVLGHMVYGIESTDPYTLVGVSVVLLMVSALAAGLPAVRATRVAPAETLSAE